jgi:hypothetical protein
VSLSFGNPVGGGGGLVYRGPVFVPGAQTAGSTQTGQATTLATAGFGITASPSGGGARGPHWGSVGSTVIAAGLLLCIYFSLPR